jgi:hypothetical protein
VIAPELAPVVVVGEDDTSPSCIASSRPSKPPSTELVPTQRITTTKHTYIQHNILSTQSNKKISIAQPKNVNPQCTYK